MPQCKAPKASFLLLIGMFILLIDLAFYIMYESENDLEIGIRFEMLSWYHGKGKHLIIALSKIQLTDNIEIDYSALKWI